MKNFMCCFSLKEKKKNGKKAHKKASGLAESKAKRSLKIRLEHPVKPYESEELKKTSFSVSVESNHSGKDSHSTRKRDEEGSGSGGDEAPEIAYEGEDEHEENASSMMRELSETDLQHHSPTLGEETTPGSPGFSFSNSVDVLVVDEQFANSAQKDNEKSIDEIQTGHVSDPGTRKAEFWGSPKLNRSCSNVERGKELKKMSDRLLPSNARYSGGEWREHGSPTSMMSHQSADRVMLKKHSSSHVLPSRSRRLWWKLFLWSHRNLHRPEIVKPKPQVVNALNRQCGYSSDTVEHRAAALSNMQSPGSFTGESLNKGLNNVEDDNQSWDDYNCEASDPWPQNQWVAFPIEPSSSSSFARIDEWVKELENQPPAPHSFDDNDAGSNGESIIFPPSPQTGGRIAANASGRPDMILSEDILHANSVIQSLNSSSTVAHISAIGLRVTPNMSCFTSLRTVNLSNNIIAYIFPGSLPKGLHTLNLSKNKISAIEGLRELTRLRVLNLSYNRISRIGQGLSNCTMIKELYLAGNKISDVEGLHRLLKVTVLDLSFNKITTTKALGQLVANYSSLQALNLLGNPIQSNVSEEQLRKAVCGLLTKLVYLNKQPIKPQRAREVLTDSVAKAALGTGYSSSTRRAARRGSGGSSASVSMHRGSIAPKPRTKNRSRTRSNHPKMVPLPPAHASSSR